MNVFQFLAAPVAAANLNENASTAGIVTLQGMLTIFLVLSILWAAIEIVHRVIHGVPKKDKQKAPKQETTPVGNAQDAAIAAAIAAALAANEDDGAVVAAITAAITAHRAEKGEGGSFRVVSFKRVSDARKRF